MHQHNYLTSEEIEFFLDITGHKATQDEIREMIEMLDFD